MTRIYVLLAGVSILLLSVFYVHHLRNKVQTLEKENADLKQSLQVCTNNYNELLSKVKLQEQEYQEKVNALLKKANKPVKVIQIPSYVPQHIEITPDDCKKLGAMIDEFIQEEQK